MTLEEANKIARIIETADGGCGHCVVELRNDLNKAFPAFRWVDDDSRDEYGSHPTKAVPTGEELTK